MPDEKEPGLRRARRAAQVGRKYGAGAPPPPTRRVPSIGRHTSTHYDPSTGRKRPKP